MVSRSRASAGALLSLGEPGGLGSLGFVEPVVSVVIPTLNEADGIAHCLSELPLARLRESGFASEVVVVDGHSSDDTVVCAERCGARVVVENRLGYGLAYKTGFLVSRGEFLVALDGDYSYPASVVPWLISVMVRRNLDFITTNRLADLDPDAMGPVHRLGNWVLSMAARLLFSVRICDSQSGMWVIRKNALGKILPKSNGMAFSQEIKIRAFKTCKSLEIPIRYRRRIGRTKICPFLDGVRNLLYLLKLRFFMDYE
jgi:glycosyltransferase involved in cell wall biosynthesis